MIFKVAEYVERTDIPDSFWKWFGDSDENRKKVHIITAPPGYGKTWFAKGIIQSLDKSRYHPIYVVANTFDTKATTLAWLDEAFKKITPPGRRCYSEDYLCKFNVLIEDIRNSGKDCLLVIDDVPSPSDLPDDSVFSDILSNLIKMEYVSVLIIGRYPDLSKRWRNIASSDSTTLPAFHVDDGREQLKKLRLNETQINDMEAQFSPYTLGVPHLNKLLSEKYLNNDVPVLRQDLWQCVWDACGDKDFIEEFKVFLCDLSRCETFTITDVEEMSRDEEGARDVLGRLMNVQLIRYVRRGRYQVVDGWREFFQVKDLCSNAINQMKG